MSILWRSWSEVEAAYELEKMKGQLDWLNGHTTALTDNDIWLTTNGYDHREGKSFQATVYAESINYLENEYNNYDKDHKWNHRFHFNPHYIRSNCAQNHIGCWWEDEIINYNKIKQNKLIEHEFGMVLGHKPTPTKPYDFGFARERVVKACQNHSFKYYGHDWQKDNHYGGPAYPNSTQFTPDKFKDARLLMAPMKFVWCIENIYDSNYSLNYLTEKIFHGFLSYSVPIYAGCYNIEQLIDKSLFIDMRDFDFNIHKIINHCENLSNRDYNGYLERIEEFLHTKAKNFSYNHQLLSIDKILNELYYNI